MPSIWITGTSSGFGRDTALALATQGWNVFASMRSPEKAEGLLAEARRLDVADCLEVLETDVTSTSSIASTFDRIREHANSPLDALLNCAGYTTIGAFEDMSEAQCREVMETNFFGALAATRAVLPSMREAGRGRILVVSSNSVNTPHPLMSLYAASKWAIEGWAEALALEVEPYGLRVVVVQPGAHRTPFGQNTVPVAGEDSPYRELMAMAGPGMQALDRWGNEPDSAVDPFLSAITDPVPKFRYHVGEDAQFFDWLKGAAPFEVRAWVTRAIVGLPPKDQFAERSQDGTSAPVAGQIAETILDAASREPAAAVEMMKALARLQR